MTRRGSPMQACERKPITRGPLVPCLKVACLLLLSHSAANAQPPPVQPVAAVASPTTPRATMKYVLLQPRLPASIDDFEQGQVAGYVYAGLRHQLEELRGHTLINLTTTRIPAELKDVVRDPCPAECVRSVAAKTGAHRVIQIELTETKEAKRVRVEIMSAHAKSLGTVTIERSERWHALLRLRAPDLELAKLYDETSLREASC